MDPAIRYKEILAILNRHFGGKQAKSARIYAAAKELFALTAEEDLEWEDMRVLPEEMGFNISSECTNICRVEAAAAEGAELRFLRRKVRA
ncbi:MAG: hypothetical protein ACE5IM_05030 [Nitrospinota bacterium]